MATLYHSASERPMPSRRLTPDEAKRADAILVTVKGMVEAEAAGDAVLLFALRRRLFVRLMYWERGTPAERTKLKIAKWEAQGNRCAMCGEAMERRGAELDRADPVLGYTAENTRLVHHECHRADQEASGFRGSGTLAEAIEEEVSDRDPDHEPLESQVNVMRALYREHGGDKEAVVAAYAKAEMEGRVRRKSNMHNRDALSYADALYRNGVAKGWIA